MQIYRLRSIGDGFGYCMEMLTSPFGKIFYHRSIENRWTTSGFRIAG